MKRSITAGLALASAFLVAPQAMAEDLLPGERAAEVEAIPGLLPADSHWELVLSSALGTDGLTTAPDGSLLFAQEQSNAIWKLYPDGSAFVEIPWILGAGSVKTGPDGNIYAIERACTDAGLNKLECSQPSAILQLTPERRVIADAFADGSSLGRLNDLAPDGHGGAFFTQGALYHASADGTVTKLMDAEAFANGVALSPDGKTVYVTDMRKVYALDVDDEGNASNTRLFATLSHDTRGFGGDGIATDASGRLFVSGDAGVYVFAPDGSEVGLIPTPRRPTTIGFAGPDRRTLYIGTQGAVMPDGKAWETPKDVRNAAMTLYRIDMVPAAP